jgi:hypothetical protein
MGDSQLGWSGRGLFALLLFSLLASFPYFESVRNANERPRLMQAMSLVDGHTWAIGGRFGRGLDPGPDVSRHPETGDLYPNKPPGASVVGAMAYASGRAVDDALERDFTLRDYTWWARPEGLSVGIVTYAFATPVFSYAHLFYAHQITALLMFVGVGFIADSVRTSTPNYAAWGGLICGTAVLVEYGAVFAGLTIGVALLIGAKTNGDRGLFSIVAGLAGAAIPIALLAWYHQTAYGSPWSTGYHNAVTPAYAAKHAEGLLGLGIPTWLGFHKHVLSMGGGLLAWSPVVLGGLYGLIQIALAKHQRSVEARLHLGIFVTMVVIGSGLNFDGGWRIGPRYLVFTLPGFILGWAHVFNQVRVHPGRAGIVFVAVFYSMGLNVLAGTLWPHADLSAVDSPFGELLMPLWVEGFHPYDVGDLLGGRWGMWLSIGVPFLATLFVFWNCIEQGIRMFYVLGATPFVVAFLWLGLMQVGDHPRAEANLEYVKRSWEPRDPQGDRTPAPSFRLLDTHR